MGLGQSPIPVYHAGSTFESECYWKCFKPWQNEADWGSDQPG